MGKLRESAFCRKVVLPGLLVVWLAGCHRWVQLETPENALREAAGSPSAGIFRVYRADDTVVEGRPVEVSGDSIVLMTAADSATVGFDDIRRAELRKTKVAATAFLITGIILAPFVLYGVGLAIACSGQGEKCLS